MPQTLEFITVDTAKNPTSAVIWLHGLGADCHDFEGLVPQLELSNKAVRFAVSYTHLTLPTNREV